MEFNLRKVEILMPCAGYQEQGLTDEQEADLIIGGIDGKVRLLQSLEPGRFIELTIDATRNFNEAPDERIAQLRERGIEIGEDNEEYFFKVSPFINGRYYRTLRIFRRKENAGISF